MRNGLAGKEYRRGVAQKSIIASPNFTGFPIFAAQSVHSLSINTNTLIAKNMSEKSCAPCCRTEWTYAHLILRLWVGLRLFMAGMDKFREKGGVTFSFDNLEKNLKPVTDLMTKNTPSFLLPPAIVTPYFYALSFALVGVGLAVILGIATRLSLLVGGLIFVSLSFGLMALPDDDPAVMLGIQVAITAFALITASHNKFSVDGLLFSKKVTTSSDA